MLNNKALTRIQALVIIVVLIIAIVGGVFIILQTSKPVRTEIIFGAVIPLTGTNAFFGPEQKFIFELAVKQINDAGGVYVREYGRSLPIRLILYDDHSDPTTTTDLMNKLIEVDKVDVILGQIGGNTGLFTVVAEEAKVPYIGPNYPITEDNQKFKWVFTTFHNQYDEALTFFRWLKEVVDNPQDIRVGIIENPDDHGKAHAKAGREVAEQLGFKVVLEEFYPPLTDMKPIVLKLKENKVNVVFGLPIPPDAINLIKAAKELNYAPLAWGLTRGTAVSGFGQALGKDSDYVLAIFSWHPSVNYRWEWGGKTFTVQEHIVKPLKEAGIEPFLAGLYYSEVLLAAKAIEVAGSLDKEKIRQALSTIDIITPQGHVSFGSNNWNKFTSENMMLFQWKDQRLEIVWPEKFKTMAAVFPFPPWNQR